MTPLMHRIANELTLPLKDRTFKDQAGLLHRLGDIHCFEVTKVFDLASDLAAELHSKGTTFRGMLSFLPAPKSWIEWRSAGDGGRTGVLLEAADGAPVATSTWAIGGPGLFESSARQGGIILTGDGRADQEFLAVRHLRNESPAELRGWTAWAYAIPSLINTPRIIGRRQHMPHRGFGEETARSPRHGR